MSEEKWGARGDELRCNGFTVARCYGEDSHDAEIQAEQLAVRLSRLPDLERQIADLQAVVDAGWALHNTAERAGEGETLIETHTYQALLAALIVARDSAQDTNSQGGGEA